ncbi:hypothetical protein DFJ74DRAFT_502251 [Hyaloraphidium curvatum]|nr:hypothetical protein DFJ74DRAFT_502251 [Hyaloraphidium curvatum]
MPVRKGRDPRTPSLDPSTGKGDRDATNPSFPERFRNGGAADRPGECGGVSGCIPGARVGGDEWGRWQDVGRKSNILRSSPTNRFPLRDSRARVRNRFRFRADEHSHAAPLPDASAATSKQTTAAMAPLRPLAGLALLLSFVAAASAQDVAPTCLDYLQNNGSFFVFLSVISKQDDLWPLLAGLPPGTQVTPEAPGRPIGGGGVSRRGFPRLPALERRQAEQPAAQEFTVFAPMDEALAAFFDSVPRIAVLQEPYSAPFWRLVSAYHVANGSFPPATWEAGRGLPTLTGAEINATTEPSRVNSARVIGEAVRTGNGFVVPVDRFIWPGDYTELAGGFRLGVNEAVSLAVETNGLEGVAGTG